MTQWNHLVFLQPRELAPTMNELDSITFMKLIQYFFYVTHVKVIKVQSSHGMTRGAAIQPQASHKHLNLSCVVQATCPNVPP